jgi:regulator of Ty1 transposition protein 109
MAEPSQESPSLLAKLLAEALPKDAHFTIYHVSTPPSKHGDIFAGLPNQRPKRAYCETQLLTVAIQPSSHGSQEGSVAGQLLVFAIEVFIYSTAQLTTLFVSKADSTGYMHELQLPKGTASPVKTIASTFLSYLARERQRPGIKCMIALFARAQAQYLFPGSSENPRKHVLDDRGLIKWWCRVLTPLTQTESLPVGNSDNEALTSPAKAYVIVPGLDKYETAALFPPSVRSDAAGRSRWTNGHPLRQMSSDTDAPPRCLIPRFPDDPKARYMDELDEELPEVSYGQIQNQPSKLGNAGHWKSVKTLEHFWEAMEFRQECSSGRSVGFIWVVFAPRGENQREEAGLKSSESSCRGHQLPTPEQSQRSRIASADMEFTTAASSIKKPKAGKPGKLTGPIISRKPRAKVSGSADAGSDLPIHSRYFVWRTTSRGQIVLQDKEYKRVHDLLLRLEFAAPDAAMQSTQRWVEEAAVIAGRDSHWGEEVVGTKSVDAVGSAENPEGARPLGTGLIRKKRKDVGPDHPDRSAGEGHQNVSTLSAGLIRKVPKGNDLSTIQLTSRS